MKRIIFSIIAILLGTFFMIQYAKCNEYRINGTIIMVANNHWCIVETIDGNRYEYDSYDLKENQKIIATIDSQDTESKNDDKIKMVKVVE